MGRNWLPYITATALVLSFIAVFPQRVKTAGIFELDLVSFENSDGREVSGGCCSGRQRADGSCPGNCSVYLHFCITHYMKEVEVKGECTFFQFQTTVFTTDDSANRSGVYDVRSQEKVSHVLQIRWPGQFSIIVEAWHPAEREESGKTLVTRFVSQKTLDVDPEWTNDMMSSSSSSSSLGIKYRIVCGENYYGSDCATFCRPRNDLNGHYMCNNQGQKICLQGWTNFTEEPRLVTNQTYTLTGVLALPLHNRTDDYCRIAVCEPKCVMGQCDSPGVCRCWQGWKGPTCSQCESHPGCKHGYCENKPFTCFCDEGWGGVMCERDLNICTTEKPCQHGATCTNNARGDDLYNCTCTEDFMGKTCEIYKNPCQKSPCENGATCKNPSSGQYICECAPGYFGQHCDTFAVICKDNLCLNGGTCIHDPEGFKCACEPGYKGIYCDEIDFANCQVYPCLNGGTCVNSSNNFQCLCPQGVTGSQCEIAKHCSSNTCESGGTCVENQGNVTCICPSGYSGTHCQVNHNRCSSNLCANRATCVNLMDGYRCDCPPGYSGRFCEVHASPCSPSPCMNGAMCHATASGFVCHCLNGYSGDRCHLTAGSTEHDWNGFPSVASNVSHRVSEEEEPAGQVNVVLIVGLSAASVVSVVVAACVVWCLVVRRKRRRGSVEAPPKAKEFDFEERLQNERNSLHLNYKQCDMPQKIVNDLDRVPVKQINEAPPKVLNKEVSNKRIPDKSLLCSSRTFQKIDNSCGTSVHCPRDYPPCNSGAIYIIEDHLRSCPDSGSGLKKEILATEV